MQSSGSSLDIRTEPKPETAAATWSADQRDSLIQHVNTVCFTTVMLCTPVMLNTSVPSLRFEPFHQSRLFAITYYQNDDALKMLADVASLMKPNIVSGFCCKGITTWGLISPQVEPVTPRDPTVSTASLSCICPQSQRAR